MATTLDTLQGNTKLAQYAAGNPNATDVPAPIRIDLNDGTHIDVAAGTGLYSTPRNNVGPYTYLEVRLRHACPWCAKTLDAFGEDGDSNVYGYVPLYLIAIVIDAHGGEK